MEYVYISIAKPYWELLKLPIQCYLNLLAKLANSSGDHRI